MCKYCEYSGEGALEPVMALGSLLYICGYKRTPALHIWDKEIVIFSSGNVAGKFAVAYCPMCGRKL